MKSTIPGGQSLYKKVLNMKILLQLKFIIYLSHGLGPWFGQQAGTSWMDCALVGWGRQGHSFLNCRGPGDAQGQTEAAAAAREVWWPSQHPPVQPQLRGHMRTFGRGLTFQVHLRDGAGDWHGQVGNIRRGSRHTHWPHSHRGRGKGGSNSARI